MSSLTDLSPELIFRIADLLLANSQNTDKFSAQNAKICRKRIDQYATGVLDADKEDETGNNIDDASSTHPRDGKGTRQKKRVDLGQEALVNLSRSCSCLYGTLSPYLFREITMQNTVKSGRAVQYLSSTEKSRHVRTLRFQGDTPGYKKDRSHNIEEGFPTEVDDVLRNLSRFEHLVTVQIDFNLELSTGNSHRLCMPPLQSLRLRAKGPRAWMKEVEAGQSWRLLIKKTLEALSSSTSNHFSKSIFNCWPVGDSRLFGGWKSEDLAKIPFFKLLAKLSAFTLKTSYLDNVIGGSMHTRAGIKVFFSKLDKYFLDGLSNATHLSILGDPHGAIGLGTFGRALIPFRNDHVPKLKRLELGYYFVQDDFLEFLLAHSSTLEHITFHQCYMNMLVGITIEEEEEAEQEEGADDDEEDETDEEDEGVGGFEIGNGHCIRSKRSWGKWFHNYAVRRPQALQRITFEPHNAAVMPWGYLHLEIGAVSENYSQQQEAMPEHRTFPYGCTSDGFGRIMVEVIGNALRALKGSDNRGWQELSEVMERNREKAIVQV